MNSLVLVIMIPVVAALFGLIVYRLRNEFSFIGVVLTLYIAFRIFLTTRNNMVSYHLFNIFGQKLSLYADAFTGFILLASAFFGLCLVLYSFRYIRGLLPKQQNLYHFYLIATLAGANGLLLAKNLFLIILFSGFLVLTSNGMLFLEKNAGRRSAQKGFIIVGISYLIMFLGTIIFYHHTGQAEIVTANRIPLTDPFSIIIFLMLLIGILAKIGAIPFHSWIPEVSTLLPASTMAFIPVIMNNLLGFYLLTRFSLFLFDLRSNLIVMNILMVIGVVTILVPVIMALRQNNLMRRLSFFGISQVGYIILGIGTATPIGIAGGLFQMINYTLYQSALFLAAGSVDFRTRTQEINQLGGLAAKMPLTFGSFLVATLAISAIPPLNGFFSQAMIYQGLFSLKNTGNYLYIIYIIAAVIGSLLILISSLRTNHSIFLGARPKTLDRTIEVGFSMNVVPIILALLCIIFGVFAQIIPLNHFILPSLKSIFAVVPVIRFWSSMPTTVLMISWLLLGILIYLFSSVLTQKSKPAFIGGEEPDVEDKPDSGTLAYVQTKIGTVLNKVIQFLRTSALDIYNYYQKVKQRRKNEKAQA
jgi:formate hydrogenlyase subunit 3/multisubunit Na+/H+ antiporter MnhD subunit